VFFSEHSVYKWLDIDTRNIDSLVICQVFDLPKTYYYKFSTKTSDYWYVTPSHGCFCILQDDKAFISRLKPKSPTSLQDTSCWGGGRGGGIRHYSQEQFGSTFMQ